MYNPALKTFLVVADCGSFLKASEKLFISPPAIMKQMNQLEQRLELQLFTRTSQGVELTEAGKSIYEDAREMLRLSKDAIRRAHSKQETLNCQIRVGSSLLYPCRALINLWNNLSYPQVRITVVPFEDMDIGDALKAIGERYDLIVGVYNSSLMKEYCRFLPLGEDRFCIAVPRSHRLASHTEIKPEDLEGERLFIMRPGNSPVNDRIRGKLQREHPQIVIEDAPHHYNIELFNRCAEEGVLMLSLKEWSDIHPSLVAIPFDIDETIPFGIIYSTHPSRETGYFLNVVKNVL